MSSRPLAAVTLAALMAAPSLALACPDCVGNTQYAGTQMIMLAGFTLLPFTLVATVGYLLHRAVQKK